jgi:hypothetical protein
MDYPAAGGFDLSQCHHPCHTRIASSKTLAEEQTRELAESERRQELNLSY